MLEKIKTGVDRLLLVLKLKKVEFQQNISENLFLLSKQKVVYLRPFLFFHHFSNFETTFYVFLTQTCKNWTKLIPSELAER